MQGQRSAVSTLPENLSFDHGSTPTDDGVDQQMSWNNMQTTAQNRLPGYVIASSEANISYLSHANQGEANLSGWSLGGTSSGSTENPACQNERKTENGWSSSLSVHSGAALIIDERQYEPSNILPVNNAAVNLNNNQTTNGSMFLQSSSSSALPQDLNMTSGFGDHEDDDCQVVECSERYKSVGSSNARVPSGSRSSDPFRPHSTSGGYLMEESDGRPGCSLDGRRLSCKRKAIEGNIGQSSGSGNSNYFQHADGSLWHSVPATENVSGSSSVPNSSEHNLAVNRAEQGNRGLDLGVGGAASESSLALTTSGTPESSRRNFRLRINGSHQQNSIPANHFSGEVDVGQANALSSQHSSRLRRRSSLFDLRPASASENGSPQRAPVLLPVPSLRRNSHPRWNGGSSSRGSSSSSFAISADRDAVFSEEPSAVNMPRNISEHPMFVPAVEMRNSSQNSTNWSLNGGNISVSGSAASTSRSSSSSGVNSSPPTWLPHRSSPQYPRRLSEIVRRSLLSSAGTESRGQSSNHPLLHPGSSSSQEMGLPSGTGTQGHHSSSSRSALLLERQLDGALGVPYSMRTLSAANEGRSRLVTEIRNVLDLMRRGEGLRFEDVMILDQSVFFGMADIHDRHRDMRLDVDNMSYEELLALEERIGNVCTGLSEETILSKLKQHKYIVIQTDDNGETEPCCICQEEYNEGEDLGTLQCGHDFHTDCIKQWLMQKNLCPICKTTGLAT